MTMLSDLPQDLIEEILCRVPITSVGAVRSTCKGWNALSKDGILCKSEPKQQFLGFILKGLKVCLMRFNLHGLLNEDLVDPSIKKIGSLLNKVKISQVYYCEGLLLCVTSDNSRLVIWNPYLGQVRSIQFKTKGKATYALGYDKNKNHKILRYFYHMRAYEVYDLKSNSWKYFKVIPRWDIYYGRCSASVNGNTYFWREESTLVDGYDSDEDEVERPYFLFCFDFTREGFGQFLPLPFQHRRGDIGTLSSVKEEKLAVLSQRAYTSLIEIWITTKIEPNEVLWIPFFKVDIEPLNGSYIQFDDEYSSFLIDEEKKVAVVIDFDESESYIIAYIIGENGFLKKVGFGGEDEKCCGPLMCSSSYVPSLVQIDQIARQKKREKKRKWKSKRKEKKRTKKEVTTPKGNKKV